MQEQQVPSSFLKTKGELTNLVLVIIQHKVIHEQNIFCKDFTSWNTRLNCTHFQYSHKSCVYYEHIVSLNFMGLLIMAFGPTDTSTPLKHGVGVRSGDEISVGSSKNINIFIYLYGHGIFLPSHIQFPEESNSLSDSAQRKF